MTVLLITMMTDVSLQILTSFSQAMHNFTENVTQVKLLGDYVQTLLDWVL